MKKICARFLYLMIFGLILPFSTHGQIIYTKRFTKKLEKCNADIIRPVEGRYRVHMIRRRTDPKYDLVLRSEDFEQEIRFILDHSVRQNAPHVRFFVLASDLATNDEENDIIIKAWDPAQARQLFSADWAGYCDFVPKPGVTDYAYGRLVSLYKDTHLMHMIIYYNEKSTELEHRMRMLFFHTRKDGI